MNDHALERQAIREIVTAMVDPAAEVLPRLVDYAMQLTGGVSAGLSLYEPDPAPGVFRWRHLRGVLAAFEDAVTPRDDSPCGVTLDRNRPTLATHPERIYDWIAAHGIVVPEVLLVPLHLDRDTPLGTLWIVADALGHFHQEHARVAADLAAYAGVALRIHQGEERLRSALEEQELLAKEMSHRLKNVFAMTDGLIQSSARQASSAAELAKSLSGRIHALAAAHGLVQRRARSLQSQVRETSLEELLRLILSAHDTGGPDRGRFSLTGDPVTCGEHAANAIALVVHELATNAAKYGALSVPQGHVKIWWSLSTDALVLMWTEQGGPPISAAPSRVGFGSTLMQRTVERQFHGELGLSWHPEGLAVTIKLPAPALAH